MSTPTPRRPADRRPFSDSPSRLAAELRAKSARGRQSSETLADFCDWAELWVTAKGRPYRLAALPYLQEIAEVFADSRVPDVVLVKAVQVGGSELLTRLMLYAALRRPLTGMYLFPAQKQMADFYDARIRALIDINPPLRQHVGGISNKGLVRFGPSHLYFRGAESIRDVISVDVDFLVFDEYDLLLQANLLEAERRIAASSNPMIRRIGIPTELGYGIWQRYEDSDQRRWHVTCQSCANEQTLIFEENVTWQDDYGRIVDERLACRDCNETLDPRIGRWIAKHPERSTPGFHVNRLMVPTVNLKTLIEASKQQGQIARQKFVTNDLGTPYSEPHAGLTVADLKAAVTAGADRNGGSPFRQEPSYDGQNIVTAGVDPAARRLFRVRVSEHVNDPDDPDVVRRALYIGTVSDWSELLALCHRYRVALICVDAGSDYHSALAFADIYRRDVVLVHELFMPKPPPLRLDSLDPPEVKVDRTFLIDTAFDALRLGYNLLPEDLPSGYVEEMTSLRREFREVNGRRHGHYAKRSDDDHAHADALDHLASHLLALRTKLPEYEIVRVPFEAVIPGFRRTYLGPGFPPPVPSEDLEFGSPPTFDHSPDPPDFDQPSDDLEFSSPPTFDHSFDLPDFDQPSDDLEFGSFPWLDDA